MNTVLHTQVHPLLSYVQSYLPDKFNKKVNSVNLIAYVCEWRFMLEYGFQATQIEWSVQETGLENNLPQSMQEKYLINNYLTFEFLIVIHEVLAYVQQKSYYDIIRMVYSSYPFVEQKHGETFDLYAAITNYNNELNNLIH